MRGNSAATLAGVLLLGHESGTFACRSAAAGAYSRQPLALTFRNLRGHQP